LKYAPPDSPVPAPDPAALDELYLLGNWHTPDIVWLAMPWAMYVGAFLMASNLRMPKLGLARSKAASGFVLVNVALGYVCGVLRIYPDYMLWPPTMWLVVFLIWGQVSRHARALSPPPIFPPVDPPPGKEPTRPEDDIVLADEIPDEE